jgi:hypothetical protein
MLENKLNFDTGYFVKEFIQSRSLISSINDKNTTTTTSDQIKFIKLIQTSLVFKYI